MKSLISGAALACLVLFSHPAKAIINGQFLPGPDFHWMVRVVSEEGVCSGSLLGPRWVLTAGHCVNGEMSVQVIDYPEDFDFQRFQDMNELLAEFRGPFQHERSADFLIVEEAVETVHQRWGTDVALLKLKNPVANVNRFPKVATEEDAKSLESQSYLDLAVAGFGINGKVGEPVSEAVFGMLKYYYYTALDRHAVRISYPSVPGNVYETYRGYRPALNDSGPASGEQAMGGPGDSGGPLLAEIDGEWKIIGINLKVRGGLRWMRFVFGGNLEMPGRFWHLKIDQSRLCELLHLLHAKEKVDGLSCS